MISFFSSLSFINMALIASLFTFFITALGSAVVFLFKKVNRNILDIMLSISSGVMIAASFWSLLSPAISMSKSLNMNSTLVALIGFLLGGIFLFISDKLFEKKKKCTKNKRIFMLVLSITLHNIPEGAAIGVAFGSLLYNYSSSALINAIILAVGIGIQNFPEGAAVSLPLRREGYSRFKSFVIGSLSAVVEPIAAVLGALLVLKVQFLLPYLLSFAAGAMIYVVSSELLPESSQNKNKSLMTLFVLIGFSIMMTLDISFG